MKKLLALFLGTALFIMLVACGDIEETKETSESTEVIEVITEQTEKEIDFVIPDESDITEIDYAILHDELYNEYHYKWVRIAGMISVIDDDRISFRQNLDRDGLTDNVYIAIHDFNGFDDVKPGEWITVVGSVGTKLMGQLHIQNATIENVGESSRALHDELRDSTE